MKIIILSVRDTGATGYNLAHAINKHSTHQCVNLRAQSSYINYPTIGDMANYGVDLCQKMTYKADVIVFLGAVRPLYEGLELDPAKLEDKKKLLLCMGSDWRYHRTDLAKQADEYMQQYQIMLGGVPMFFPAPNGAPCPKNVKYLPPTRSFSEIRRRYGLCNQDERALRSFKVPEKKVVFAHAPTNERNKGSATFYRVVTHVMEHVPYMRFLSIRKQAWASCLTMLSGADVLLDQNPPFPFGGYGAISIEASIFKSPVVTKMDPRCIKWLKEKTGLDSPFITFKDEEELATRVYHLATDEKLRRMFGNLAYKFCKALHDEKPVVERFFKIIEEMN